jgi:hypothetical protein
MAYATQEEWRRGKINISQNIAPFLKKRPREESWNQGLERGILRKFIFRPANLVKALRRKFYFDSHIWSKH